MGFYATEPVDDRGVGFEKRAVRFFPAGDARKVPSRQAKALARKGICAVGSATFAPGVPLYGYRYYNPELGRWPSRDPIGDLAFSIAAFDISVGAPCIKGVYSRSQIALLLSMSVDTGNGYLFVMNTPTVAFDDLGLQASYPPGYPSPPSWTPTPGNPPPLFPYPVDPNCQCPLGSNIGTVDDPNVDYSDLVNDGTVDNQCTSPFGNTPPGNGGISFLAACQAHDQCYATCNANKAACDNQFRTDMLQACNNGCSGNATCLATCNAWAKVYYGAVVAAGNVCLPVIGAGDQCYNKLQEAACDDCCCP